MNEIKKRFIEGLKNNKPQILTTDLIADIETPISCLLKLKKNQKYSFLLESVEGGSLRGRYSLLGCDPDIVWEVKNNKAFITSLDNNYDYEIVIIDDGSTDKTVEIAKENGIKNIISLKRNMGLGFAFNRGRIFALEQGADILVNTDADNQYKSEFLQDLIEHLKNSKTDIVVGVRKFDEIKHFSKSKIFLQEHPSIDGILLFVDEKGSLKEYSTISF